MTPDNDNYNKFDFKSQGDESDTDIVKMNDYDSNYDSSSYYSKGRVIKHKKRSNNIGVESVDEENEMEYDHQQ